MSPLERRREAFEDGIVWQYSPGVFEELQHLRVVERKFSSLEIIPFGVMLVKRIVVVAFFLLFLTTVHFYLLLHY